MKKNKTKKYKVLKVLIIIFLSVFIVALITGFVAKFIMTKGAIDYLQGKYDMSESQLDIVDYEAGRFHLVSTDWIFEPFVIEWYDYKWEFNYNGREFFVNRIKGKFYDDYQLEDIQICATDWLSKNINEKIIGIQFDSSHLLNYQLNYGNQSIITKKETIEFFNNTCIYNDYIDRFINFATAIYVEESYYNSLSNQEKDDILNTIKNTLPNSEFQLLKIAKDNKIEKGEIKYSIWVFDY